MLISTFVFLFFLLLTYVLFLLASRKSDLRAERLQQRVAEALGDLDSSPEEFVEIAREDTIGGYPAINRLLAPLNFVKKLDAMIRQAGLELTVSRLLAFSLIAGILGGLAAYTIFNPLFALVVLAIAAALPILRVARQRSKRLRQFNAQLPDTLDLLSRSLGVGHAFSEALHQVGTEMPEPISSEFRITFEEQKLGLTIKAALDRLTERVPLADLRLCVTAMHIQRETGGNLSEILERVAQTIRDRFKLMEDFRTMTTSARGSAWILCGLPFVLVFFLTTINPDYMSVLINDKRGHYVLGIAIVMQGIGMLLIKKILNIRF